MKLHTGVLNALEEKQIKRPTPIQMQGIPSVYAILDILFFFNFKHLVLVYLVEILLVLLILEVEKL